MKSLHCQKRQRIVIRGKNGSTREKYRCANGVTENYRHDVSEITCESCVLRRPLLKPAATCKECAPSTTTWPEPYYHEADIVYPFQENIEQPPIPEGYNRKTSGWQFESKWEKCPYRQFINQRTPKGDLQIQAYCDAQYNHAVSYKDCKKCLTDMGEVGGNLDAKFIEANVSVPAAIKRRTGKKGIPSLPGTGELLDTYWKAVKRWVVAGRPIRDAETVRQIHEDFCSTCDWHDPESKRCKGCGCVVKPEGIALLNKIKMQTEHCPRSFW